MIDALLWAVRKAPRSVWAGLGLLALCGALIAWSEARRSAAYERGKRDAAAGVVFDSVMLERAAIRVAKAMAHTDTVTQTVVTTRWRVDTLVKQLPPNVAALPPVAALVASVNTLTVQVDSLTAAHVAERLTWTEKAKVDSAALYALRVIATAQRDTITTLAKRPRWRTVVGTGAVMAVAGFVGGIAR